MAFFLPRTIYHTQPHHARPYHNQSSSPLYSLLNELDAAPRRRSRQPVYYVYRTDDTQRRDPDFKAQETANVYLIRGQVPDVTKENLTIEFPDPQKMVISGKVVEATAPVATGPHVEPAAETPAPPSPVSESGSSRKSYQATVEDDHEDDDFDMVSELSTDEHGNAQPAQTPARQEHRPVSPQPQPSVPETAQETREGKEPRVLYEFSKTFTFPNPIDLEGTTADLKDGVLTVVVPKPKKAGPRRILVN